jgi:hypothetical protein
VRHRLDAEDSLAFRVDLECPTPEADAQDRQIVLSPRYSSGPHERWGFGFAQQLRSERRDMAPSGHRPPSPWGVEGRSGVPRLKGYG